VPRVRLGFLGFKDFFLSCSEAIDGYVLCRG